MKLTLLPLLALCSSTCAEHLTLTALLSDPKGNLRFECWEMQPSFTKYPTVGMAVSYFADVSNISYVILPPRSTEGYHKPPHAMLFVLLSGLAQVTIPEHSDEELWIAEGVNGIMVAADTVGEGHVTEYPLDKETHALQIPFREGRVPEYRVVRDGVCDGNVKKGGRVEVLASMRHGNEIPL